MNLHDRGGSMFLDPSRGFQNECVITLHVTVSVLIESRLEKYFHM